MENVPPSVPYQKQAYHMLKHCFPRISCKAIATVLEQSNFVFGATYNILSEIQDIYPNGNVTDVYPAMPPNIAVFVKFPRKLILPGVTEKALLDQMAAIPDLQVKENIRPKRGIEDGDAREVIVIDDDDDEQVLLEQIVEMEALEIRANMNILPNDPTEVIEIEDADGEELNAKPAALYECGCCYGDDFKIEDVSQCDEYKGHYCCKGCIYRFVSEKVDGNNSVRFSCMVDTECSGKYPVTTCLDKFLTPGLSKRVNRRVFLTEMESAGIEEDGGWICLQCNHVGFVDKKFPTVFCAGCKVEFCQTCKGRAHIQLTCKDEKKRLMRLRDPVRLAEDAMTAATIRKCPKCSTEFQKDHGCNKMTCSNCGTWSCYLCSVQIEGYKHFCNTAGCTCGRCRLWADVREFDRRARNKACRKVLQNFGYTAEQIVKTGLLAPSPKPATAGRAALPQPANQQGVQRPPNGANGAAR